MYAGNLIIRTLY